MFKVPELRTALFNATEQYQPLSLNILFGESSLPYDTKVYIFEKVHKHIMNNYMK